MECGRSLPDGFGAECVQYSKSFPALFYAAGVLTERSAVGPTTLREQTEPRGL